MSLMAASDGWAGTLAFVALCVAGILVRRALPLTNKHLKIFGFVQKKK
ncbi:MAG: hypothetical protein AB7P31_07500 [Steroidobacteraceae bacterium]